MTANMIVKAIASPITNWIEKTSDFLQSFLASMKGSNPAAETHNRRPQIDSQKAMYPLKRTYRDAQTMPTISKAFTAFSRVFTDFLILDHGRVLA